MNMNKELRKIIQIMPAENFWLRCTRRHEKLKDVEDVYYLKIACFALVEYLDGISKGKREVIDMVNCGHTIDFSMDTADAEETIYSIDQPKDLWHDDEGKIIPGLC